MYTFICLQGMEADSGSKRKRTTIKSKLRAEIMSKDSYCYDWMKSKGKTLIAAKKIEKFVS